MCVNYGNRDKNRKELQDSWVTRSTWEIALPERQSQLSPAMSPSQRPPAALLHVKRIIGLCCKRKTTQRGIEGCCPSYQCEETNLPAHSVPLWSCAQRALMVLGWQISTTVLRGPSTWGIFGSRTAKT